MRFTVAIVEDNADISAELEKVIGESAEFECVCTCANALSALQDIPARKPDIVVMDISLPDGTGIDCTRQLKQAMPDLQILIFTVHNDPERIFRALAAGASGYVLKRSDPAEILHALQDVASGGVPMTSEIARKVIASFRTNTTKPAENLTPREQMVLGKLAEGLSDKEIADALSITAGTVGLHLRQIYRKLHVRSRTEAVIEYMKKPL